MATNKEREAREEEEESFEDELMPFLEMGIAEEEEEVERELIRERKEVVVTEPLGPLLEPKEEVVERKIPVEPFIKKRFPIAASILIPLLLFGGGVSYVAFRINSSNEHLDKGLRYIKEERFNEAEDEFRKGIRERPFGKIKEYNRFGLAYLDKNEYQLAEAKFKYILKERPRDLAAYHGLIKLYLVRNDRPNAKKAAVHILEKIAPGDVEAILTLGKVALQEGVLADAFSYVDRAFRIAPKNTEVIRTLQRVFMARAEYDKALSVYRYIVAKKIPRAAIDPDILIELGDISLAQNQSDLAEELFRAALNLDPHRSRARYGLALVFVKSNWLDEACRELNIIKDDPRFTQARGLMGEISLRQGRFEEAERYLKEAVSLRPQDPENHYRLGNLYYATARMAEAIKAYELAGLLGFKGKEMSYNLGVAYYEEGGYEKAITYWQELLKDERENPTLNYSLGNAYVQLLNWPKAKERYEVARTGYHKRLKALELAGTSPELEDALYQDLGMVYNNIGVVYEALKMNIEALRAYARALECASWARKENRIAYRNLNRSFENRPLNLKEVWQSIHTGLKHSYLEG